MPGSQRGCPECQKANDAAWKKANPERAKAGVAAWRKANPERKKANDAAWRAANRAHTKAYHATWHAANRVERNASDAAWRVANPDKAREIEHRYRARKRGNPGNAPITREFLVQLFDDHDGKCRYCPTELDKSVPASRASKHKHLDHLTPIARGGPHAPHNVCWACKPCNLKKHTMTEDEFIAYRNLRRAA